MSRTKIIKNNNVSEEEREMLKLTLKVLVNENSDLRTQFETLSDSVKKSKEQLSSYVSTIVDKDSAVESLKNQIENLRGQLKDIENKAKIELSEGDARKSTQHCLTSRTFLHSSSFKLKRKQEFDFDTFYSFCDKQNELLKEIQDVKREIIGVDKKEKSIVTQRIINMNDVFDEDDLKKISINEKSKNYLVDEKGNIFLMRLRDDLNEETLCGDAVVNHMKCNIVQDCNILIDDMEKVKKKKKVVNEVDKNYLEDDLNKGYYKERKIAKISEMLKDSFII